jgi:hypothetical protein
MGALGANVLSSNKDWNEGGQHVTIFFKDGQRQSWDVDANGRTVERSSHYSESDKKTNKLLHDYNDS